METKLTQPPFQSVDFRIQFMQNESKRKIHRSVFRKIGPLTSGVRPTKFASFTR